MIGTGRKALDHKVQEPCKTDAHRPTNPAERDALTQQVLDQRALLMQNAAVSGVGYKLASACLALMILFTAVNMAVLLELY